MKKMKQVNKFVYRKVCAISILLCFCFFALVHASSLHAQNELDIDARLESALLAENWAKVVTLLDTVNEDTPSPVLRLIKAHACLALNRNNESLRLLLSSNSAQDLSEWEKWTQDFYNRNPNHVLTHYFKGDSMARLSELDSAIEVWSVALNRKPLHALMLNARGVCRALGGAWDEAIEDFDAAAQASPTLAEPRANRGAMYVLRSTAAKGALSAFDTAIKYSANSALARMGRACALFGAGKWREAEEELQLCQSLPEIVDFALINLSVVRHARLSSSEKQLASADEEAGVTMKVDAMERAVSANRSLQAINQDILRASTNAAKSSGWAGVLNDLSKTLKVTSMLGSATGRKDIAVGAALASMGAADASNYSRGRANQWRNKAAKLDKRWQGGINSLMAESYYKYPESHQAKAYERLHGSGSGSLQPAGGVTTDLSGAHVDSGNWGVFVPFGILYTGMHWSDSENNTNQDGGRNYE